MIPRSILLFAAGLGTRMAPLTLTQPKPLVNVAGRPLIDHALAHCDGLRIVVNVHYLADQMQRFVAGTDIIISDETAMLLETGGGLKKALPLLGEGPVFTMNTDAVWRGPNPIKVLSAAWRDDMDCLLLMIPKQTATGHTGAGDFDISGDGRLQRGAGFVYSGVQIIRTDALHTINDACFSMWALWDRMLADGTMYGVPYSGGWCDVGRPDSIPLAEAMLEGPADV